MKSIILSVIILAITVALIFGILAFAEWNIAPYYWNEGTRVIGSCLFACAFLIWIFLLLTFLLKDDIYENRN